MQYIYFYHQDCPPDAGDFRAQQCSAHADVRFQGQYHEWLPVNNDPENPCALKCKAKGLGLMVELAPKVLDGTRCYTESLDMCISGVCQVEERNRELNFFFFIIEEFIFISLNFIYCGNHKYFSVWSFARFWG